MPGSTALADADEADDTEPSLGVIAVMLLPTLPLLASAMQRDIAPTSAVLVGGLGLLAGGALYAVLHRLQLHRRESWVLAVATPIALFGLALAVVVYAVVREEWALPWLLVLVAGGAWGASLERLREAYGVGRVTRQGG